MQDPQQAKHFQEAVVVTTDSRQRGKLVPQSCDHVGTCILGEGTQDETTLRRLLNRLCTDIDKTGRTKIIFVGQPSDHVRRWH